MQYMLLIYEDERLTEEEGAMESIIAEHIAFANTLGDRRKGGAGLERTRMATTVRTGPNGAKTVHDGPFAETKEQLGGFYIVEAADLDEALTIARKVPLTGAGAIEVRPLLGGDAG